MTPFPDVGHGIGRAAARVRAACSSCRVAVAASAGVACLVLMGCASSRGDGSTPSTIGGSTTTTPLAGRLTPMSDVLVGQCFDLLPDAKQQPFAVLIIACRDSHTYEVFASDRYTASPTGAGAPYPGALVVANNSENQCFAQFADFMGIQWEASDYDIQAWWPSEPSWTRNRDRTVICAVYRVTGGATKGSVRGTAQ